MAESVYKVIELSGTSKDSGKAASAAVSRASKSLAQRVAEVVSSICSSTPGKIEAYRAN